MLHDGVERVEGVDGGRIDRVHDVGVALDVAVPVVDAVDRDDLELGGQRVDLAQEVLGGEAALAERVRRGCSRSPRPGSRTRPARSAGLDIEPGVARVVELELVDRDAGRRRCSSSTAFAVADRADQRGVLDEGAEVLGPGPRCP